MGAKGLRDALLVIDHDIERKIRCSVEVLLNSTCDVVQSVEGKDKDEDRIAKSNSFNCELERVICITYFSAYLL